LEVLGPQRTASSGYPLEIDADDALARVSSRGGPAEPVFERRDFLERVAALFHRLERPYILRLDGDRPADAVAAEIGRLVEARLVGAATARTGSRSSTTGSSSTGPAARASWPTRCGSC
jgi:hypothetical protein